MAEGSGELARVEFQIAFEGDAVDRGRMDVAELAPALMGLGELFRGAGEALGGNGPRIKLEVTAVTTGSFVVTLDLVQTFWEHAKQFVLAPDAQVAKYLWDCITGGAGVLSVIKLLRGRPRPEVVLEVDHDHVEIRTGDQSMLIRKDVLTMVQMPVVREGAERLTSPLRHEGIDTVRLLETASSSQDSSPPIVITKDEAHVYVAPPAAELGPPPHPFHSNDYEAVIEVVKPWFDDDATHKWTFRDARGQFNATVQDLAFRQRIEEGQESFRKGDLLRVIMRATTTEAGGRLSTDLSVQKVLNHIERPTQGSFRY